MNFKILYKYGVTVLLITGLIVFATSLLIGFNEKESSFTRYLLHAPFSGRAGHTCTVFKGKLWLIGGWDGNNPYNDVWYSKEGLHWYSAGPMPFKPRAGHTAFVYNDKLYIVGGLTFDAARNIIDLNDIWATEDGISWQCVKETAEFMPRGGHACTVFNNTILLVGGIACGAEAFKSDDGINWHKIAGNLPFGSRGGHVLTAFNNKLWVIGGIRVDGNNNFTSFSDVWNSYDGIHWKKVASNMPFFAGGGHGAVVYKKSLWVIGGFRKGGTVYRSDNGKDWELFNSFTPMGERVSHSCTVFKDRIILIGGFDGTGFKNDVWAFKTLE
ncbi:MAG: kelch repeat-containing protein [Spirochaetota bacterium]